MDYIFQHDNNHDGVIHSAFFTDYKFKTAGLPLGLSPVNKKVFIYQRAFEIKGEFPTDVEIA